MRRCLVWLLLLLATPVWAQHVHTTGAAPTVSSCGTSPGAITGNDMVGSLTLGSVAVTGCTVTFAQPWASTPVCMFVADTVATLTVSSVSTTAVTVALSLSIPGAKLYYYCIGR